MNALGRRIVRKMGIAVLAVLGFAATWWLVSARHWFLNPDHERTRTRAAARASAPEPVDP